MSPEAPLAACLPEGEPSADALLSGFLRYTSEVGLELYEHQEEAILAVLDDKNVIVHTPTGSGKSLIAAAVHFKAVAERHMGDRLDVNGDGTLDWFFDQWVLGAGVPGYSLDYAVREEGSGYIVTGRIDVEGGSGFVMPVPVHATTVDGNSVFLGDVLVRDESAELFFGMDERPEQIVLDPNRSILRR